MNWIFVVAAFPLLWRFLAPLVPPQYIEPYAYWDAAKLNTEVDGRVPRWRNMGYWKNGDETFTEANAALAQRLVTFADAKVDGHTLDMAHGAGESLLIHLDNGATVDALTTLPAETEQARALVADWAASHASPNVTFFTASAGYRSNKDFEHPLNPMRGFMGEKADEVDEDEDEEDNEDNEDNEDTAQKAFAAPTQATAYDLVYVLDAAYHFPPAVGAFVASVLPVLAPGGVLAYTDVLPPPSFSKFPLMLNAGWLAPFLSVPRRNLNERPGSLAAYAEMLEKLGYEGVKVEDWSENVFLPLAANVENRGAAWWAYAKVLRFAHRTGWRFVAVRGAHPK